MPVQAPTAASNFGASTYSDPTGRSLRCFDMTRDGFMLFAMGFTGAKALGPHGLPIEWISLALGMPLSNISAHSWRSARRRSMCRERL
ncbi:MAG: hypothetical protein B7Z15_04150 [Rhizobiales bacterium 32-66-8]|nr:MAG: hypothetical protein B7Z15_04150 [Rhizobiales bacterium 32-66-8]